MLNSQLRQAAVILLSLPKAEASLLLGKLAPAQIEVVAAEMARLHAIGSAEQELALRAFAAEDGRGELAATSGLDAIEQLLSAALGDRGTQVLAGVRRRLAAHPFEGFDRLDNASLLIVLRQERPQTIALVLAHLPMRRAAELLQSLPPQRQASIIRRIAALAPTDGQVLCEVAAALERQVEMLTRLPMAKRPSARSSPGAFNATATDRPASAWPLPLAS